jgi:hypothetical protein
VGTDITRFQSTGIAGNILDLWTPIIGGEDPLRVNGTPRWLPLQHRRRIKAYEYLEQLNCNVDAPVDAQADMRPVRFGTVAYTIQLLRDLTVGGEQRITVQGAEAQGGDPARQKQQTVISDWAERNRFFAKMQEAERQAGLLGDVFYRLRLGKTRGQLDVKIDVIHPSFVFPVFDVDGNISEVDLIWEEYRTINGIETLCVYKDTYEFGPGGHVYETAGWYLYTSVPALNDLALDQYDTTVDGKEINKLDLALTEIPVYHLPNFYTISDFGECDLAYVTDAVRELNAADTDLSAAASLLGVPPMVVAGLKGQVRNGVVQNQDADTVGPGKVWNVDTAGGKAEYMDNSTLLKCLLEYYDRVEHLFFRNIRLGKMFSGQTDNIRDIESGKAFKTLLASLYARVAQKRTVRKTFYSVLFGAIRDMFILLGKTAEFPEPKMYVEFGNVLPSDNSDDLKVVAEIWAQGKGPISAETAVRMAAKAGSGVVDYNQEAGVIKDQVSPPPPVKPSFSLAKK